MEAEMDIKNRHYDTSLSPVPRYSGDVSPTSLDQHLLHQFEASAFFPKPATPQKPKLIQTADGTINRMLLTIPSYAVLEPVMAGSYRSLLQSLPPYTKLVVLAQAATAPEVEKWVSVFGLEQRTELSTFGDTLNISIWAEDGYVVALDQASSQTYFVEPYSFPRYGDGLVAKFVANFTDLRDTQAPLYFQGGNTLIGDDFVFIGADYPAKSLQYIKSGVLYPPAGTTAEQFIKDLYSEYLDRSRKIYYIGSTIPVPGQQTKKVTINGEQWTETIYTGNDQKGTVQPLFHIDMFLTLAGRASSGEYQVLVGDPQAASAVLGQPLPPHSMQPIFDDIAQTLKTQGYKVIRNPLPLIYMDDTNRKERVWYFATANNALVEVAKGKNVWLPTYGHGSWPELSKTDAANKRVWEQLGFTVHMLGDFHPFAENLGAVHCIKKYLARG
jgi:hypothetical protein